MKYSTSAIPHAYDCQAKLAWSYFFPGLSGHWPIHPKWRSARGLSIFSIHIQLEQRRSSADSFSESLKESFVLSIVKGSLQGCTSKGSASCRAAAH